VTVRPRQQVDLPSVPDGGGFRFAPGYRSRGFAAATERGPLSTHMDSRFRENDTGTPRERGLGCLRHGLDEPSPYATSLRCVPPIGACRGAEPLCVSFVPQEWMDDSGPDNDGAAERCQGSGFSPGSERIILKRVQGRVPAEGLGVSPNFLLYTPKSGGRGLKYHS